MYSQSIIIKRVLLLAVLFITLPALSQQATITRHQDYRRRNFAWYMPSGANEINGLAAGLWTLNTRDTTTTINGMNVDLDFPSMMIVPYLFIAYFKNPVADTVNYLDKHSSIVIKGVNVSGFGTMYLKKISGVYISGAMAQADKLNGVSISVGYASFDKLNGISIAILKNYSIKSRGVQISLWNICDNLKGVQIGLWNKNQKRSLPLTNWNFKD